MSVANEADNERQNRRQQVDEQWDKYYHPQRARSNQRSKAASTDLARLDIADWLARQKVTAYLRSTGDTSHFEIVIPEQRPPHSPTIGARRQSDSNDQPGSLGDPPEFHESQRGQAKPGAEPDSRSRPEPKSDRSERGQPDDVPPAVDEVITCAEVGESLPVRAKPGDGPEDHGGGEPRSEHSERGQPDDVPPYPSAVEQVEIFAKAMTGTWAEIAAELGDTKSARDIKRQLAHHFWCDLFIGLVQVIETCRHALDRIPESAKDLVKRAIRRSSMEAKRSHVTSVVVDAVVDRVWQAFKGAMVGHVPLLSIITREDALRSLRILAVFTCPAPEKHKEVREHALKPLGDDARGILTAQTKTRLAKLFDEQATGGDKSTSADLALATP
ncbi:MAG: hypothetical protein DLM61_22500 [Pseudonocardiales bacterium]|nr:MAG: hypothetical protein DLM61_22500 [Pseudonocardiales bacterium]